MAFPDIKTTIRTAVARVGRPYRLYPKDTVRISTPCPRQTKTIPLSDSSACLEGALLRPQSSQVQETDPAGSIGRGP